MSAQAERFHQEMQKMNRNLLHIRKGLMVGGGRRKNARLPPEGRYCDGHNNGTKAAVIKVCTTNLLSIFPIFFIDILYNFNFIYRAILAV